MCGARALANHGVVIAACVSPAVLGLNMFGLLLSSRALGVHPSHDFRLLNVPGGWRCRLWLGPPTPRQGGWRLRFAAPVVVKLLGVKRCGLALPSAGKQLRPAKISGISWVDPRPRKGDYKG